MAQKKQAIAPESIRTAVDQFLSLKEDVGTVNQVEQRLELHITGTTAYIPSYTRQVMDAANGAPIMALYTKTDKENNRVYVYSAKDPKDKQARRLRSDQSMGPAYFAFGVPLRTLGLKFTASRRLILPLTPLEVPDQGTVWWISFADIEKESRNIDLEAAAAAKQAKAAAKQAKAAARRSRKLQA